MRRTTSAGVSGRPRVFALFVALAQFQPNDLKQPIVIQRLVGMAHPGLPKILDLLGDEAVGEAALETARGDHRWRSLLLDSSRSRRNTCWLSSLMASMTSFTWR
jgi:hypothetical protein